MENNEIVEETPNAAEETSTGNTNETATPEAVEVEEVYSPDDSTLERAVKAGLSLADAKALPSKDFADRILGALEGNPGKTVADKKEVASGDGDPAIDFSGFSEEDGYDPKLVSAMGSLKSVIEAQAKVIRELKAGMSPKKEPKATVETRKNLTLARPGGEAGRRNETPASAEADILSALRSKFKLS